MAIYYYTSTPNMSDNLKTLFKINFKDGHILMDLEMMPFHSEFFMDHVEDFGEKVDFDGDQVLKIDVSLVMFCKQHFKDLIQFFNTEKSLSDEVINLMEYIRLDLDHIFSIITKIGLNLSYESSLKFIEYVQPDKLVTQLNILNELSYPLLFEKYINKFIEKTGTTINNYCVLDFTNPHQHNVVLNKNFNMKSLRIYHDHGRAHKNPKNVVVNVGHTSSGKLFGYGFGQNNGQLSFTRYPCYGMSDKSMYYKGIDADFCYEAAIDYVDTTDATKQIVILWPTKLQNNFYDK